MFVFSKQTTPLPRQEWLIYFVNLAFYSSHKGALSASLLRPFCPFHFVEKSQPVCWKSNKMFIINSVNDDATAIFGPSKKKNGKIPAKYRYLVFIVRFGRLRGLGPSFIGFLMYGDKVTFATWDNDTLSVFKSNNNPQWRRKYCRSFFARKSSYSFFLSGFKTKI